MHNRKLKRGEVLLFLLPLAIPILLVLIQQISVVWSTQLRPHRGAEWVSLGRVKADYRNQVQRGDVAALLKLAMLLNTHPTRGYYRVTYENVYPDNFREKQDIVYLPREHRMSYDRKLTDYEGVDDAMIKATAAAGETVIGLVQYGAVAKPMDIGWCGTGAAHVQYLDRHIEQSRRKMKATNTPK